MSKFYDYHVELELPCGYKDEWSGASNSRETALQVASMVQHRGQNATEDFTAVLRVYGNNYDRQKAFKIKETSVKINAGFNAHNDSATKFILAQFGK